MIVARDSLLKAVKLAASIAPRNSPKLCLQGVLLKAGNDNITVYGTDLEQHVSINVHADGGESFEALPNAVRLLAVLQESTADQVALAKEDDCLILSSEFAETVLKDADDPVNFPAKVETEAETFDLEAGKLHGPLKKVSMYSSTESARYALNGVRFETDGKNLVIVATDGKWLAVDEIGCNPVMSDSVVVSNRAIGLILQATAKADDTVMLGFTRNRVYCQCGNVTINGSLEEGRFPTWREVFPKRTDYKVPLMSGPMDAVTRQASVMMTDDTRGVNFHFGKGTLKLKSASELGKANIQLPVAFDGDKSVTIAGDLVSRMLGQWEPDTELTFKGTDNNTVTLWEFPGKFRTVIVPLAKGGE